MGKRYRGDSRLSQIKPEPGPNHSLLVRVKPCDVHMLVAIIQSYSHLSFPAEINPKEGLVLLHTTPGCYADLLQVVEKLPCEKHIQP